LTAGLLLSLGMSINSADAAEIHATESTPASADITDVDTAHIAIHTGGGLRLRYERKYRFSLGKAGAIEPQDYLLSQLRLHVLVDGGPVWRLYLEGQDSRLHSGFYQNTVNDSKAANIFADRFDIHQAYLDLMPTATSRIRLGRQKFNLGALRLVASLEWVNTARVWDGIRLTGTLGGSGRSVDVFASRLVPVRPRAFNTHAATGNRLFDSQFHGVYYTDSRSFKDQTVEAYYLLRRNTHVGDHVNTYGARYAYQGSVWKADAELMLQNGRYGFISQRAYAAHVGAGRSLGDRWRLDGAYNLGSGDSNPTDGRHQTFDNLYPLNHAYYGYMDLFSLQNILNAELVLSRVVGTGQKLRLAVEDFRLSKASSDAWYNAGAGIVRRATAPVSSHVGTEIDLTYAFHIRRWPIGWLFGYSYFIAGNYVRQTGTSSDADFLFLQSSYKF
ncbi:MAG: alginate export family protein, partial [Mariprofundaceae bacterium]